MGREEKAARILLVEDDESFTALVQAYLRNVASDTQPLATLTRFAGVPRLDAVGTLAAARERLAARHYDLVLLDLNLPDSAGLDTLRAVRATGEHIVIVMTGDEDAELPAKALEHGAYDFIAKGKMVQGELRRVVRFATIQAAAMSSLRASEGRFRQLAELTADAYWEQDEELRFTAFVQKGKGDGLGSTHLLGKHRWDTPYVNMSAEDWARHKALLEARQPFHGLELCRIAEGHPLWVSTSGAPVFDDAGRFRGYRGIGQDITARKRDEQRLRMEHAVTRCLAEAESVGAALEGVLRAICETEGWECGRYYGIDPRAGVLRMMHCWSVQDEDVRRFIEQARDMTFAPGAGLAGKVWLERRAMWSSDLSGDGRALRRFTHDFGIRGVFVFPVLSGDKTLGVMVFSSRVVREPDDRLLASARIIGSQVGLFLERKNADAVVSASEERFRRLTQLTADAYWEQDEEYRFVAVTEKSVHHTHGVKPSALLGKRRWDVGYANMTAQDWQRHIALLEARQPFHNLELCRMVDGKPLWVSTSGEPLFDEGGRFRGYRGVGQDITARKREEQVRSLELAVTRALAESDSASSALRAVIRAVCESEHWMCGRFFGLDEAAQLLRCVEIWGPADPEIQAFLVRSRDKVYRLGEGFTGIAWQTGKPLWVGDISKDGRASGTASGTGIQGGTLVVPVLAQGRTIGVLSFQSKEVREPDERLMEAFALIGAQVGQVLKRITAETAMRESEARFRSLTALSADWYWEQDADFRLTFMSRPLGEKTGLDAASYLGRRRWEQPALNLSEEDWARHRSALERHEPFRDFEMQRPAPGGGTRWLSISGEPVLDAEGRFKGYRGIGRDITARKREEALLRLEHNVTRCLAECEAAPEALERVIQAVCESEAWECGRYIGLDNTIGDMRVQVSWSVADAAVARFIEVSKDTDYSRSGGLIGEAWRTAQPLCIADVENDDRVVRKAALRQAGLHGAVFIPVTSAGETIGLFAFNSRRIGEPDARLLQALVVIGSQTGQFLIRNQAENEHRRFRVALDTSADMIFLIDRATMRYIDVNETACRLLGYTREELLALGPQDVLPVSREDLERSYDALIANPSSGSGMASHYRCKDGSLVPFESTRRVLRSGARWIIAAISRDTTERQRAEEQRAAQARYQKRIAAFGEAALAMRDAEELIALALRNVLEGLGSGIAIYVERRSALEAAVRQSDGLACEPAARIARYRFEEPLGRALDGGEPAAGELPFGWARGRTALLAPVAPEGQTRAALCALGERGTVLGAEEARFLAAAASVLSAGLKRIASESRLSYLAQFDALTGLPNRALLADRFAQLIAGAKRRAAPLSVLFVDLDEFKLVNDTLGHAGGDELLKEVAVRLQSSVRSGDTVARISGDEFAVLLADLGKAEDAALVAQKIIGRLGAAFEVRGKEVFASASIGIAAFPADGADPEALLSAADAAMYRAKQSGRNTYQFFTAEIENRTRARAQLGGELRRALEREEFRLVYQPKVEMKSAHASGCEALLRWQHPSRGMVSPAEFIPILEESGLIVQVGEWVLRQACSDIRAWQAAGLRPLPVAVNLSARQFRQPNLAQTILALLQAGGVAPAMIELEITESQLMQDPDHAVRAMRALTEAGMRIVIDDFGTGYSSLAYLTRFPLSALKIDRSFVAGVLEKPGDATIVRTIIDMAHALGFAVVAEGVETEEQRQFLHLLGCEQAQGYLFSKPVPADAIAELLTGKAGLRQPPAEAQTTPRRSAKG